MEDENKIIYDELIRVKSMIYSNSLWCLKDILEGIVDIEVEETFKENSILSDDFLIQNIEKVKIFILSLRTSQGILEFFLDKLEFIIENNKDNNYSEEDEKILTMILDISENITTFCQSEIMDEHQEFSVQLLEDISKFNEKYEELLNGIF